MKLLIYFSLIPLLLISASIYSQDNCSQILKYGIFDLTSIKSEDDFSSQFLDWFSNSQYSSTSNIQENGFGIEIDGFGFDNNNSTGNSSISKAEFMHKIINDEASKKKYQGAFKKANPDIINAWAGCAQNKTGLIVSAIRIPGSETIKLKIQVKRKSDRDRLDTLKIRELIFPEYLTCKETFVNKNLSETNVNEFYFEIDTSKLYSTIYFKVITNFSDYSSTIDLIGLKKITIIKVTYDNLLELNQQCSNVKNKNICRAIREYFSEKSMNYKLANPGTQDFCYEQMAKTYDDILNFTKQYEDEVKKNNNNETDQAKQYKGVIEGLVSQQESLIKSYRLGNSPCKY